MEYSSNSMNLETRKEKLNWKCKFLSLAHHFDCIESGLKGGRFYSSFNLEGLVR